MDFRILGPLEVLDNGQRVDLGGAKQRALLAVLLLHANESVSTDALIDALWGDAAPDSGRKALHVYVSGLRKALGKERIVTQRPGYRLHVEPSELDLARCHVLLAEGNPAEALSLWRGAPLADFAYEPFAQSEIGRLDELRLACLEERIDGDLAAGRHRALVGELEALVAEHPLREPLRARLMLALYRSGRQAEALDVYQDARRALTDQLGIEPSRSLRDLHQAILQQDAALDLAVTGEEERAPEEPPLAETDAAVREPDTRAERKTVSVLHVDFDHDVVDPEVSQKLMTRACAEVTSAVEAHGGTVQTVTGDAISAVFGLPFVHEDDATRAVRAAEELQRVLAPLDGLEARLGVSTGGVVTGGVATGGVLRASGEPFRMSARLARESHPGELMLDDATRRMVEAARREGRRFVSPMVGRGRERRRLQDAFEQAAGDSSCQLFTILGAAGVGKSRLVEEFLLDLGDRALVARGRCLPYGEGITFWPVLEAIKDAADLDESASAEENVARLAELIADEPEADGIARRVVETIGMTEARAGAEEGVLAVQRLLEAFARRGPVVVVFDDVHWGETLFLDLVEHLAEWSRGVPLLLLCVARPELLDVRPAWAGGKLNATTVLLEPLSHDECSELVANLVGEAEEIATEVRSRIAGAAEGNPLFVEEMLSMLIDDGLLVREDGRWTVAGDLTVVPVPATIHALLAARLDQLGTDERRAIEAAAVEGEVFHDASVARLTDSAPDAARPLAALVRKELVRPDAPVFSGERAYRFRHLLIRDAAYESIPKEARATLHERHVEWLEQRVGERAVEFDEIVGYHLERAYRYRADLGTLDGALGRRAAERLGGAGRRAFLRSDASAGVNLISRAVALLPAHDPLRVELVPNVRVIQGLSDLTWADRVLTEAVEAAATTGDRRLAAHALVQRGFLRLFVETDVTAHEVIQTAEQAIAVFEDLGDDLGLARAWRLTSQAHYLGRRAGSSVTAAERALGYVRRTGDRFEERETLEWLVIGLLLGPMDSATAAARCASLLEETVDHAAVQPQILAAYAQLEAMRGRSAEARVLMARSKRLMDELGDWIWIVTWGWAYLEIRQGDPVAAERELRPAYEALSKIGETSHFSTITHELSTVVYARGEYDEAERLTRECEAACRANDVHSQIHWRSIRAKALARKMLFDEAERLAREAIEYAETTDFLLGHGDALADLAEVLELAGRREEAARALDEAIELYERKGNRLAIDVARDRLATLA